MLLEQFEGFGSSVGPGNNPAIIVIDFINGFTNDACPLGSNFDKEIKATEELLHIARQTETPIIFTTVIYEEHFKEGAYFIQKVPALKHLTKESEWVEIDSRLEKQESEPLIIKKFASAFFGTNLSSLLAFEGIDTTLILGCTTSGCVRATAVDAIQHGYRVIIPEECVGDRSQQAHEANLYDIQTKYGDVINLETVKNYLLNLKGE
ncbi:isochorismatase family protein [Virgibacillus oceani]